MGDETKNSNQKVLDLPNKAMIYLSGNVIANFVTAASFLGALSSLMLNERENIVQDVVQQILNKNIEACVTKKFE